MMTHVERHLSDDHGSATLDWVEDDVLFARTEGCLSAELGGAFARALDAQLGNVPSVHYFGDASRLEQYDLLARSAFMRVVLAERRKLTSFTLLTWAEGISNVTRNLAELLGPGATVLTDRNEFDRRLLRRAPGARVVLDGASTLVRIPLRLAR